MPSPFPGMNPYLEQEDVWQDFHDTFIPFVRDVLASQLQPHYIVKVESYLFIHEPPADHRVLVGHGDVGVARNNGGPHESDHGPVPGGTAVRRAPVRVRIPSVDLEKHLFLEIRDRVQREIVTVIEMLSPSNKKPGPDREQYLAKRGALMRSTAHFVEIDLLRGGPCMPMEMAQDSDYSVMISRVEDRPEADYWPLSIREVLPTIPIPLRAPHPDGEVNLQDVLNRVYDSAQYAQYVYKGTPNPPLSANDAAWAQFILAKHV